MRCIIDLTWISFIKNENHVIHNLMIEFADKTGSVNNLIHDI